MKPMHRYNNSPNNLRVSDEYSVGIKSMDKKGCVIGAYLNKGTHHAQTPDWITQTVFYIFKCIEI